MIVAFFRACLSLLIKDRTPDFCTIILRVYNCLKYFYNTNVKVASSFENASRELFSTMNLNYRNRNILRRTQILSGFRNSEAVIKCFKSNGITLLNDVRKGNARHKEE